MAVRIRYKAEIVVSSSSAEEKDLGNQKYEVANDEQNEGGSWKTVLAAAATNVVLNLGNVALARFISIRTSAKDPTLTPGIVRIRLGDIGADEVGIQPMGTSKEGLMILTCEDVDSIYASNPGSVIMDVIVSAAGD